MNLNERIDTLIQLGDYLLENDERLQAHMHRTHYRNNWFTKENQATATAAVAREFLEGDKLRTWAAGYDLEDTGLPPKRVGLIPAANIPLVWFHDMLCLFLSGNVAVVKLSERDEFMLPFLVKKMTEWHEGVAAYFEFPKQLPIKSLDAVIATGSNNTTRYFKQYFGHLPNIIRRNRHSLAVLHGDESTADFHRLGRDVFQYFGLGCRSVSKVFVPRGYDFTPLLDTLHEYKQLALHTKYKNNFDYQFTILILNKIKHLNNGCLLLIEDNALASPIAVLHYEEYDNLSEIMDFYKSEKSNIQCIVSNKDIPEVPALALGKAQSPCLSDYADNVDTMRFLLEKLIINN